VTTGQRQALRAVGEGKVTYDGKWSLVYDADEINPQSLAACRRRGWVQNDFDGGAMFVTVEGEDALLADDERGEPK
jgi:hypothetical protein